MFMEQNFNSTYSKIQAWLQSLGVLGLYLFSLSAWASTAFSYLGLEMMILPILLTPSIAKQSWKDPLVKLSVAFTVLVLGIMVWAGSTFPGTWRYQIKETKDLLEMGFFYIPLVAFWISGDPKRSKRALALALIGFVARVCYAFLGPEGYEVLSDPMNYRFRAGMPANAFGVYASIAMLGIVLLAPAFWGSLKFRSRFTLRVTLWGVVFLALFQGMMFSQSRSAWAALFMILPVLVGILFWDRWRKSDPLKRKQMIWTLAAGLLVTAALLALNRNILSNRMLTASDSISKISEGDISGMSLPALSLSIRFYLWNHAWEKWKERPVFGWGPGGGHFLLKKLKDPNLFALHPEGVENFHNSFVQIAIQMGVAGLLCCGAFLYILFYSGWRSFRAGDLSLDIFLTVMGAWVLFLLATMSNIRTDDHLGQFFAYLFGGIAYAKNMYPVWQAASKAPQTGTAV